PAPAPAPAKKSPARPDNRAQPSQSAADTEPRWRATEAPITIISDPPGAAIYRGESYFGKTPQTFTLERGDYDFKFELQLTGYQSQEIVVRPTGRVTKNVKLKRSPAAATPRP
ncbi:MAG TPA: PEGA domain-containing protein, partial [Kofleriaceae bacterium]|nr:PEGA domain-containing protein [Kofleriaceae bacterium]